MRIFTSTRRTALQAAMLAGTGLGLVACSGSGLESATTDPMQGLLGGDPMVALGLRADPNAQEIEYTPRSPLVLPRDASQLPPPQQQAAQYGANWPDDPDERARRELAAARKAAAEETVADVENASDAMSPQELRDWAGGTGGRGRAGQSGDYVQAPQGNEPNTVNPRELLDRRKGDPSQLSRAEPLRGDLTEPPAGYRTPAATADGAVVVGQEEKKKGFFGRLFGG